MQTIAGRHWVHCHRADGHLQGTGAPDIASDILQQICSSLHRRACMLNCRAAQQQAGPELSSEAGRKVQRPSPLNRCLTRHAQGEACPMQFLEHLLRLHRQASAGGRVGKGEERKE